MGAFRQERMGMMMHAHTFITDINREQSDLNFPVGRGPMPPWDGTVSGRAVIAQESRTQLQWVSFLRLCEASVLTWALFDTNVLLLSRGGS